MTDAQTRQHMGQDHVKKIDAKAGEIPRTVDSGLVQAATQPSYNARQFAKLGDDDGAARTSEPAGEPNSPERKAWIDYVTTLWNEADMPIERRLEEAVQALSHARFPGVAQKLQWQAEKIAEQDDELQRLRGVGAAQPSPVPGDADAIEYIIQRNCSAVEGWPVSISGIEDAAKAIVEYFSDRSSSAIPSTNRVTP